MLVFDIETEPVDLDTLKQIVPPFTPPPPPGEFDPASVKLGNLKDEAKRQAKIDECRAAHEAEVAGYAATLAAEEAKYWADAVDKAALSPLTGRIIAIGYRATETAPHKAVIDDGKGNEATLIEKFWAKYQESRSQKTNQRKLVGCNVLDFDLPFLIRRSWMLGVDVPSTVRQSRYFDPVFIDIRELWLCGQKWNNGTPSSLDVIGKAFGIGGKCDGVCGKDFAKLWRGTPEERSQAEAYLLRDLEIAAIAAERMGVV